MSLTPGFTCSARPITGTACSIRSSSISLGLPDLRRRLGGCPHRRATEGGDAIALLVDEIVHLGESDPVLLVLEDAHWIDHTTRRTDTRLADSIGEARLLVLVTARPDSRRLGCASPGNRLTLNRLSRAECARLVAHVAAAHGLQAETVAAIVAKTDGVPLFVEELTRAWWNWRARTARRCRRRSRITDGPAHRLDEAREVAQIAAVIGRQFAFSVLAAIAARDGAALDAALDKLVAAGIVLPEGRGPGTRLQLQARAGAGRRLGSLLLGRVASGMSALRVRLNRASPATGANEPGRLLCLSFR